MRSRIEKYKRNYNAESVGAAYEASKKRAVEKEKIATEKLVYIEEAVKQISDGQSVIHLPYYIIFGKEIYSKTLKHRDQTLIDEVCILYEKWVARGLDANLLNNILALFSLECDACGLFRFDISLLDGCDTLV